MLQLTTFLVQARLTCLIIIGAKTKKFPLIREIITKVIFCEIQIYPPLTDIPLLNFLNNYLPKKSLHYY